MDTDRQTYDKWVYETWDEFEKEERRMNYQVHIDLDLYRAILQNHKRTDKEKL
jgi:hypothetical protein